MSDFSRRWFMKSAAAGVGLGSTFGSLLARAADGRSQVVYQPTQQSLNSHPVPDWFHDGKLGIFIHWGLYSVPGYAPKGSLNDILATDYERAMVINPYAEDYWNAMKDASTPTARFHREHYGDMPYQGFRDKFQEGLKQWDPTAWAREFRNAGASYVVLTAKYADGYCLWPSRIRNPNEPNWTSQRDLVRELAAAVRAEGMRFGVYYSGGIDWSFNRDVVRTIGHYINSVPGGDFPKYSEAQVRELIERYDVDVLWNDIVWCTDEPTLFRLFADYYNAVPEGVVNDRWTAVTEQSLQLRSEQGWRYMDEMFKERLKENPDFFAESPPAPPHCDFRTPEWVQFKEIKEKKWEVCRGMGSSWGYNRTETEQDYTSSEELLFSLIDAASKNGNMLLNIGPRGEDAQIPQEQLKRLREMGEWLRPNRAALYGTRPWTQAEAVTATGEDVRITQSGRTMNLIVCGRPRGAELRIKDLSVSGKAKLLADGSPVTLTQSGPDLILKFGKPLNAALAPVISVTRA